MGNPFDIAQSVPVAPTSGAATLGPNLPPAPPAAAADQGNPLDQLGRALFGQGNKSLLGGIPGVGDIGRFAGEAASGLAGLAIKPVEIGATIASHIPTFAADEPFRQMGAWQKANDPAGYAQWQIADAAAKGDLLGGGNTRANFTREWGTKYLDTTKEGPTGPLGQNPGMMFTPSGSLGGGLVDALGLLGVAGQAVQQNIAGQHLFGSGAQDTRVQQIVDRASQGQDLNPLEQQVVDHLKDGSWTPDHATSFMVRNGQGLFRDFIPQMIASLATDPTTWAMLGSGAALKLGGIGVNVAERAAAGGPAAETALESLGSTLHAVQASALAPVFKAGRGIIDPFGALGKDTATAGLVDLTQGAAVKATERTYGAAAYSHAFELASQHGFTTELQSALGTYSANLARKFVIFNHRLTELKTNLGENLINVVPDSVVEMLLKSAPKDAVTRLTDYASGVKQIFVGNPADDATLAGRLTAAFGRSAPEWAADVAKMSNEEKSLWHAATYSQTWRQFGEAISKVGGYRGSLPLDRLVVSNDSILDDISAQALAADLKAATGYTAKAKVWNDAAAKFSDIADIGKAQEGIVSLRQRADELQKLIMSGKLHTRVMPDELADPTLKPLQAFIDAHTVEGQPLWHLAFAPDSLHAWGLTRDDATGLYRVARDPFVSNVMDATPAYRPVSDVARNLLGQVIGPVAASKLAKPIDAVEIAAKTMADAVSGQRLLMNMEQRFYRNMTKFGVSPRDSSAMFRAAREATQLQHTTLQGAHPENIWKAVEGLVPSELKGVVTKRALMSELLDAAGGDLRIMGLTSGFTQRMRTILTRSGIDAGNYAGDMTVNFYRMVRYSINPTFYIQRITDGIYFNILKGIPPTWTSRPLTGALAEAQQVLSKIGETAMARDFAFDMPEYQLRSNFQQAVRDKLAGLPAGRLESLSTAGTRWQVNNQVANFSSHLGEIVHESLAEARGTFEKMATDTTLTAAERQGYADAAKGMDEFAAIGVGYSQAAGRNLSQNEIGLKYLQEIFNDSLGAELSPDGIATFKHNILTGEYHKPADIGQLQQLGLDHLAADLGYVTDTGAGDVKALRQAISPSGDKTVEWLRERLKEDFSAHPDFTKRAVNALTFHWQDFWSNAREALDLSPPESLQLQGIIAREAKLREMTPVEYLSQVLKTNIGETDLNTHLGKLLSVVKGGFVGSERQQIGKLTDIFMGTLDPSGQRTVLNNYRANLPDLIQKAYDAGNADLGQNLNRVKGMLEGGSAASGGAVQDVSAGFADLVARRAAGEVIDNPDVEAIVRHFVQWTRDTVGAQLGESRDWVGKLANELAAKIPTDNAFAYNRTEALVEQLLKQKIALAQRDAFMLAEMSSQRTMLSRTLNHPVFALYPSSYMWGKVLPEMVKFIAKEPFGFDTSAGAYLMAKVEQAVAIQREYDPNFATAEGKVSSSATAFLADYLTPSLPWSDMRAATSPFMQSLAKNGLDLGKMAAGEFATISPTRWASQAARAGSEIAGLVQTPFQPAPPTPPPGAGAIQSNILSKSAPATPATPASPDLSKPIQATGLNPVLVDEMQRLQAMLGKLTQP